MTRMLVVAICLAAVGLDASQGVLEIDKYLRKYGYIDDGLTGLASDLDRTRGLKSFQRFSKLPITGIADNATIEMMKRRRCGCQDMMTKKMMQRDRIERPQQFNLGPRWPKTELTWRISRYTSKLNQALTRQEIIRAFRLWEDRTPLRFFESRAQRVDIDISFAIGEHNDGAGNAFDGVGGVLAHAFFPEVGDTHFDEDENWSFNSTAGTDFFTVAAHEFGHALGLSHSEISDALMAPFYQGYNPNFELHEDDIRGIQSLYGGPITTGPTTTPRPMTTMRPTLPPRTTTTTARTTTVTTREWWCDGPFSALFQDFDGTIYVVLRGSRQIIEINNSGDATLKRATDVFQTYFPRRIDGAYSIASIRKTFLMRGKLVLQYDDNKRLEGFIIMNASGREMPVRPTAAMASSQNTIYIFGNGIMWYMSPSGRVISGSHRYTGSMFPGIPGNLNGAMQGPGDSLYFLSGTTFYEYDTILRRVRRTGDFGSEFMRRQCGRN